MLAGIIGKIFFLFGKALVQLFPLFFGGFFPLGRGGKIFARLFLLFARFFDFFFDKGAAVRGALFVVFGGRGADSVGNERFLPRADVLFGKRNFVFRRVERPLVRGKGFILCLLVLVCRKERRFRFFQKGAVFVPLCRKTGFLALGKQFFLGVERRKTVGEMTDVVFRKRGLGGKVVFLCLKGGDVFAQKLGFGVFRHAFVRKGVPVFLRLVRLPLFRLVLLARFFGSAFEILGFGGGFCHAVDPKTDLQFLFAVGENQIFFRVFRRFFKRFEPSLDLRYDVAQTHKVRFGLLQLFFRVVFAVAKFGDAGGFFENMPPFVGFLRNDLADLALSDDRITLASDTGV